MWIVTFMTGSLIANLLLRWAYGKKLYFHELFIEQGYDDGYRDGATNVKMYYSMKSELPSMKWLKDNHGKLLDTRVKFLAAVEEGSPSLKEDNFK